MIYEIKGDLLNADEVFIAHQVNCKGVMGAGVARQIKNKLLTPIEFEKYRNMCQNYSPEELLNGTILAHGVKDFERLYDFCKGPIEKINCHSRISRLWSCGWRLGICLHKNPDAII